jgi:hypothetical protein
MLNGIGAEMPETDQRSSEDGGPTQKSTRAAPAGTGPDQFKPVETPPAQQMTHHFAGSSITVEEKSGVAAAEATGKISTDNEEDPEATAGSG